jgi:hypothetical protein
MIKNCAFFLVLTLALGAAFAQDPPPGSILRAGAIEMIRASSKFAAGPLGTIESTTEVLGAAFSATDLSQVNRTEQPHYTVGPCIVTPLGQQQETPQTGTSAVTYLDAGPVLNLTGPAGSKQIAVNKRLYGGALGGGTPIPFLPSPPPLFVTPGTYTADNGAGGADVGPFTATLTLDILFQWTNPDAAMSIDRAAGVDITWTGGDPNAKVNIGGGVVLTNAVTRKVDGGAIFTCSVDNGAGHFVLPPEVLSLIPASTATSGVSNGNITVSHGVEAKFDAPGVGPSSFFFISGTTRLAEFK